ncbi:MAG TPA: amidohydrolase family protein [Gemmatimonadales bacterium]|nr:amidohydrolase family protein [Gemmatimonadales bacterium]
MPPCRLSADWVLPIASPPIGPGAVLIDEAGRIAAVGADADVPHGPEPREHFPGCAIIPGLVNAHTHLELTGFDGLVPEHDFVAWIARVRALKLERSAAEYLAAARRGLRDCFAAGVTTVADTGDSGAVIEALHEAGGSGIAYLEVFGPHPADAAARVTEFRERLAGLRRFETERIRLGASPHAPYTVSGPLLELVAALARAERLPLAVHIAESAAESELLACAGGAFAEAWRRRGIPLPESPGPTPVEWLARHGALGAATLCIHAVRVDRRDVDRLRAAGAAVAHCPRSNRRHGHGDAPLAAFLGAGLRVGVGTDSVASVSPLDLLAETRAAAALGGLDPGCALELCTIGAARALGLDAAIGSLEPGKWGDCAVVRLPPGVARERVAAAVLDGGAGDVVATFVAGRPVHRTGRGTLPA